MELSIDQFPDFKSKALTWASRFDVACYFDSNGYNDPYSAFDALLAVGTEAEISRNAGNALAGLQEFLNNSNAWALGFLAYDLKNEIEQLESNNQDNLNFPDLYFFRPRTLILIKGNAIQISSENSECILNEILSAESSVSTSCQNHVQSRYSTDEYIDALNNLKQHILRGDIYEVNFCQEFFCENASINPLDIFQELNQVSPTPFATFFKLYNKYIISATPERFLSKRGTKLISQPIKGTSKRSNDPNEDEMLKDSLGKDEKERSENVMIVDLVRNDLTKCAVPGSVRVEELFGIYSFEQVHQMISTVVCQLDNSCKVANLFKATFPMGSMTGAPKVSAMELIEKFEKTKRGVFSGAVGYFAPNGDFDFNVVIRTLLYNSENKYLSFQVGSAITYSSDPEKEYEECMLKAGAMLQVLGGGIE